MDTCSVHGPGQSVSDYGEPETGWFGQVDSHLFAGLYELLGAKPVRRHVKRLRRIPMKNSFWAHVFS